MKKVYIIHGWSGSPKGDWIPWLSRELRSYEYKVEAPEMPDTDEPTIEAWVEHIREAVGTPSEDTYFVGHSIGCQAILRYLETLDTKVGGAVFVAGWFDLENMEDEEVESIAAPWIERHIDLEKVSEVLPHSTLFISEDDPYGAFDYNVHKFTELGSSIVVLPNAGHITEEDGFTELPQALEELENMSL